MTARDAATARPPLSAGELADLRSYYSGAETMGGGDRHVLRLLAEHAALTAARDLAAAKHIEAERECDALRVLSGERSSEIDTLTADLAESEEARAQERADASNLRAQRDATVAALATRDAELAKERDRRRLCTQKMIDAIGANGPEDLEQTVSRALLLAAGLIEERDAARAELAREITLSEQRAVKLGSVEGDLAACRRERDDAQKASMAPLLLRLAPPTAKPRECNCGNRERYGARIDCPVHGVQPPAEPRAVSPRDDAPLDVHALPAFWHEQRRLDGKPDMSRCAVELERAWAPLEQALRRAGWDPERCSLIDFITNEAISLAHYRSRV